jgi:hypothetical protein
MDTRLLDAHITSVVARTPHTPDQTGADLRA